MARFDRPCRPRVHGMHTARRDAQAPPRNVVCDGARAPGTTAGDLCAGPAGASFTGRHPARATWPGAPDQTQAGRSRRERAQSAMRRHSGTPPSRKGGRTPRAASTLDLRRHSRFHARRPTGASVVRAVLAISRALPSPHVACPEVGECTDRFRRAIPAHVACPCRGARRRAPASPFPRTLTVRVGDRRHAGAHVLPARVVRGITRRATAGSRPVAVRVFRTPAAAMAGIA